MGHKESSGKQQSDGKNCEQVVKSMNYWVRPARPQARIRKSREGPLWSIPADQQRQSYRYRDNGGSGSPKARDGLHLCGALTSFSAYEVNARESTGDRTGDRTQYDRAVSGRRLISRGGDGSRGGRPG